MPGDGTAPAGRRAEEGEALIRSDLPARLDRLPWSRFHWLLLAALGTGWIIDGLEVTLVGALASVLTEPTTLALTPTQVGAAASIYLAGAILGAIGFGDLADRMGRRRLFFWTLGLYASATVASGFVSSFHAFALLRFLTGAGIGGEYAAINSAIQEFMPARVRGRVDLAVNGSFWVGAALGAAGAAALLDSALVPSAWGWRLAFVIGGALAVVVLTMRRFVPESPRWLLLHGRPDEAEQVLRGIERRAGAGPPPPGLARIALRRTPPARSWQLPRVLFAHYPRRTVLGLVLMASQAFLYNALFFTYALVLTRYQGVPSSATGWYLLPFAAGNFLGPLLLGPLFDSLGRRAMITSSYALTGLLIVATGVLFLAGELDALTQTLAWSAVFFVASAAASSAYLTVGEVFPLEVRARAIAWFYALGTAAGGLLAPLAFGALVESGARIEVFYGYAFAGALMLGAAAAAAWLAVDAERRGLEAVAAPLAAVVPVSRDPPYR